MQLLETAIDKIDASQLDAGMYCLKVVFRDGGIAGHVFVFCKRMVFPSCAIKDYLCAKLKHKQ
jgi:hypothetical protein